MLFTGRAGEKRVARGRQVDAVRPACVNIRTDSRDAMMRGQRCSGLCQLSQSVGRVLEAPIADSRRIPSGRSVKKGLVRSSKVQRSFCCSNCCCCGRKKNRQSRKLPSPVLLTKITPITAGKVCNLRTGVSLFRFVDVYRAACMLLCN